MLSKSSSDGERIKVSRDCLYESQCILSSVNKLRELKFKKRTNSEKRKAVFYKTGIKLTDLSSELSEREPLLGKYRSTSKSIKKEDSLKTIRISEETLMVKLRQYSSFLLEELHCEAMKSINDYLFHRIQAEKNYECCVEIRVKDIEDLCQYVNKELLNIDNDYKLMLRKFLESINSVEPGIKIAGIEDTINSLPKIDDFVIVETLSGQRVKKEIDLIERIQQKKNVSKYGIKKDSNNLEPETSKTSQDIVDYYVTEEVIMVLKEYLIVKYRENLSVLVQKIDCDAIKSLHAFAFHKILSEKFNSICIEMKIEDLRDLCKYINTKSFVIEESCKKVLRDFLVEIDSIKPEVKIDGMKEAINKLRF